MVLKRTLPSVVAAAAAAADAARAAWKASSPPGGSAPELTALSLLEGVALNGEYVGELLSAGSSGSGLVSASLVAELESAGTSPCARLASWVSLARINSLSCERLNPLATPVDAQRLRSPLTSESGSVSRARRVAIQGYPFKSLLNILLAWYH